MKTKKKLVILIALCLSLAFSGCGTKPVAPAAEPDRSDSDPDTVAPEAQIGQTAPENAAKTKGSQTAVETSDAYPSAEKIKACLDAGGSKLFWCAETPEYSGTIKIPAVEVPDATAFSEQLAGMVIGLYQVERTENYVIEMTPGRAGPDLDGLLNALMNLTDVFYHETTPEEIYKIQFVPYFNQYPIDAEGFHIAGASDDYVPGSYLGVSEDENITIFNPLIIAETPARTVDASELVTPEEVEMVCRAYYENPLMPFVTIIKSIALEYYYSKSEESLLPAWRCEMSFYASENGHDDSILLDAQTGELLRK